MEFRVEKAVLDAGVKIVFAVISGLDNTTANEEWLMRREVWLEELLERYKGIDVHQDAILEGFNILHEHTGVKRRKNIPASENLVKLLLKHGSLAYINKVVDIYNIISLDSKLALGAHNIDYVSGNVTLRLEIRQVQKTLVDETARNVFYIVQGNEATSDELLLQTAQQIIDLTTKYSGGKGKIIIPKII